MKPSDGPMVGGDTPAQKRSVYPNKIDVRDCNGNWVRTVGPSQARQIVALRSGRPVLGNNRIRYIELTIQTSVSHARPPCAEANFTIRSEHNHNRHSHIGRRCEQYRT